MRGRVGLSWGVGTSFAGSERNYFGFRVYLLRPPPIRWPSPSPFPPLSHLALALSDQATYEAEEIKEKARQV